MITVIKKVCVCGAGTMGSGIAQVCATAGYHAILYDLDKDAIKKGQIKIEAGLQKLADQKKIDESGKQNILSKIQFTSTIEHCIADLVIEAVVEKMEVKISLFKQLMALNNSETIYTSNTSSLSIKQMAKELKIEKQLTGLHFFNPAPLMKLIEIVKTDNTDERLISILAAFVNTLNKTSVVCKDSPGFIVNRVARPFYIESLRLIEAGKISFELIDKLLEAKGFKMGPFKLMDLIGNDVNFAVSASVYEQLGRPKRLEPSRIQKEKVETVELGKKTGKGYYKY
jgi:3-hydroxybutyryl-CoA dehydrogenase